MTSLFRCPTLSRLIALGACWLALAIPAHAAAPNALTLVDYGPQTAGNALAVARVADNAGTGWTWQLNGAVTWRHNNVGETLTVDRITISYPGANPAINPYQFQSVGSAVSSSVNVQRGIFDGHHRDLSALPPTIRLEIKYKEYSDPAVLELPLAFYENTVPGGAFFFPSKQSDLPDPSWRFHYGTRHTMDKGIGDQRWGYDIAVRRWNGSDWRSVKSTAESKEVDDRVNSDYLIWGVPLYAMGDGVVVACYDGEVDHDPQSGFDDDNPTWEFLFGNHLEIDYGGDRVVIAHSQHGSIPSELCPGTKHTYHTGLNIPVRAGQYIGRVGNTGRSTNAHIHLHVYNRGADDTTGAARGGRGVPANFRNLRSVADQADVKNLGQSPSLGQHDGTGLHRHSLFQPNPCGYPEIADTASERSFINLSSECYQDMFNVATAKGWMPTLLDGYEVSGIVTDVPRFNATFRPGTASWTAYHDRTAAEMADAIVVNVNAGRRIHVIDAYKSGSQVRYAALFFARPGLDQDVFFDRSQAQWEAELTQMSNAGYVPVNVTVVQNALGALRYTSVWEQFATTGWTLQIPPASNFSTVAASEEAAGRKPVYVNAFKVGSTPYVAGLFVAGMGGTTTRSVDVDTTSLSFAIGSNLNNDRPIRGLTGYDGGLGNPRFAAVWRSPINTTITGGPANGSSTTSRSATFWFRAHHPFSIDFRCRKSSTGVGLWLPCTSPKTYNDLALGEHSFEVRATDRDLLIDPTPASRTWTVLGTLPVNQAPTTTGIANQSHSEGATVALDVRNRFSDPDGDNLTLSTESDLPDGLGFSNGVFSGTLSFVASGSYSISVTASDGRGGTVEASFTWTVTDTPGEDVVFVDGFE
jgi:hypothetical protein